MGNEAAVLNHVGSELRLMPRAGRSQSPISRWNSDTARDPRVSPTSFSGFGSTLGAPCGLEAQPQAEAELTLVDALACEAGSARDRREPTQVSDAAILIHDHVGDIRI